MSGIGIEENLTFFSSKVEIARLSSMEIMYILPTNLTDIRHWMMTFSILLNEVGNLH